MLSLILTAATTMAIVFPAAAVSRPGATELAGRTPTVMLRGNVSPIITPKNDLGVVNDTLPTGALFVLLGRNSSEQRALDNYVLSLSSEGSADYHRWLTPSQYGKRFGTKSQDITAVSTWLTSQGFTGIKVNKAKTAIEFSGSMGSIKTAFKTEIHEFKVDGEDYYANVSNPQIPATLAPIVRGVVGLNRPVLAAQAPTKSQVMLSTFALKPRPALTVNAPDNAPYLFLTFGDAAIIYDAPNAALNPAYAGTTVNGSGVTIGAVEVSDLSAAMLQYPVDYRTTLLNNTVAQANGFIPEVVVEGVDPGVDNNLLGSFDAELNSPASHAVMDVEISQALAPGSKTILYVAQTTEQALARAIDDNKVSILIVSTINNCESSLGAATNAFLNSEYEQAAAQGITVVSSAGEMGADGCYGLGAATSSGLGVNGEASSPWDVAVGGSEFQILHTNPSQYFNLGAPSQSTVGAPPYYTTALSYIPEVPWNATTIPDFTTYQNNVVPDGGTIGLDTDATGGGRSSEAVCSGTISGSSGDCSGAPSGYVKPAWQTALTPNDGVRDLPDITLFAGSGTDEGLSITASNAAWAACWDGCTGSDPVSGVGGTSGATASAAAAAGIFALIEQSQGQRLGLVTPTLYKLASLVPAAFHDMITGNNSVGCTLGSKDCGANSYLNGYNADIGYDLATGLGSLDVAKLLANWDNAGLESSTVTLTAGTSSNSLSTGAISVTHGAPVDFNVTVTPDSATGNIALINDSGDEGGAALPAVSLSNGTASFTSPALPGGSYMVQASYSGDANDIGSESNAISVTVNPEPSTLGIVVDENDPTSAKVVSGVTSVPYGTYLALAVTPYGSAGEGKGTTPTGAVSATYGSVSLGSGPLSLVPNSGDQPGTGYIGYFNSKVLLPGTDSISVSYLGDSSYEAATASVALAVTKGPVMVVTGVDSPKCAILKSDWSVQPTCTASVAVDTDSVGQPPTGVVSIAFNGATQIVPLSAGPGTSTGTGPNEVNSVAQTSTSDVTSYVGTYLPTVTASYAGDANYEGGNGTDANNPDNVWVVSEPSGASFTLSASGAITTAAGTQGTSAITVTPESGFVGPVALSCTVSGGTGSEEPTCSIPTVSTVTSSSPQTVTLALNSTATTTASVRKESSARLAGESGIIGFLGLVLCGLLIRKQRRAAGLLILILSLSLSLLAPTLLGCGGGGAVVGSGGGSQGQGNPGTPPRVYTVTIKGTNPNVTYTQAWISNPITSSTSVSVTIN